MQFGLIVNLRRQGAAEAITTFSRWAKDHHEILILSDDLRHTVANHVSFAPVSELPNLVDVLVAMGGDGTILATARSVRRFWGSTLARSAF